MTRPTSLTVELIAPNPGALRSGMKVPPAELGVPNCVWLKRLKNSARKFKPMFSQGRANCLMTEKSVFTKSGPDSGVREAFPSSPGAACANAQGLNQFATVCTRVGQPEPPPPLFGSLTWSGRARTKKSLFRKLTPLGLEVSTTKTGKPDVIFSMRVTCQFPKALFMALLQLEPKCLPLPKGRS